MLLDTSGVLIYLDDSDPRHLDAVEKFAGARQLFIHNYVLAELVPLARKRRTDTMKVFAFLMEVSANPEIDTVWVSQALHQKALSLLRRRVDKGYSLCDAVSFIIMDEYRITNALTTDRHFEQEGFVRLLKS